MRQQISVAAALIGALGAIMPTAARTQQMDTFTVNGCVDQLTVQVDPPYRLPRPKAVARCTAIAGNIHRLSTLIIGTWTNTDGGHGTARMRFLPNGHVMMHAYNWGLKSMHDEVGKWAFVNPYGTVGQEGLQIDGGTITMASFAGRRMTLTSQPADTTIIERWTRVK